jgi:transposase
MRDLIDMLWAEWKLVEQQIEGLNDELERISAADAGCTRIRQIPGIGPVVATAIVAAIGNGAAFRKGRDFAAWLGIVPRQYSTGGKVKLLGISKRGNVYLGKILIHGARAAVLRIKRDRAPIGAWLDALDARAPKNVVVVAMANKQIDLPTRDRPRRDCVDQCFQFQSGPRKRTPAPMRNWFWRSPFRLRS